MRPCAGAAGCTCRPRLDHPVGDGEPHERARHLVLGVAIRRGGDDGALGTGYAVREEGEDRGRDARHQGVGVLGGHESLSENDDVKYELDE